MIKEIRIDDMRLDIKFTLKYDTTTFDIISIKDSDDDDSYIKSVFENFYVLIDNENKEICDDFLVYLTRDQKIVFLSADDILNINYQNFTKKLLNNEIITRDEIITYINFLRL